MRQNFRGKHSICVILSSYSLSPSTTAFKDTINKFDLFTNKKALIAKGSFKDLFSCGVAQCLPGTISVDGLERCRTCPLGEYQHKYAQTHCAACPPGKSTLQRGSSTPEQCRGPQFLHLFLYILSTSHSILTTIYA